MRKISIVGFGKIGQALGAHILTNSQSPVRVHAIDLNPDMKSSFEQSRFKATEPGVESVLSSAFREGKLSVDTSPLSAEGSDAILVAIPLYLNGSNQADLDVFTECVVGLAPVLKNGCVLSVETTIPTGSSRHLFLPKLEAAGKKHGVDYFLVHSPERIKSGSMLKQLATVPKILGGVTPEAARRGAAIYGQFIAPERLNVTSSIEVAELIKLAGMVYRDINIAISNQLAAFTSLGGLNIDEVIRWANTDGEAHLLQPGIGVGGHCTPVYPYFLIENFKRLELTFSLAEEARRINDGMSEFAVKTALARVPFKKALILGLGFRPDVAEDAYSTTYLVCDALKKVGVDVGVHDPLFPSASFEKKGLLGVEDPYAFGAEAIFLVTYHSAFKTLDFAQLQRQGLKVFVDGRNALKASDFEKTGIQYLGIGRA